MLQERIELSTSPSLLSIFPSEIVVGLVVVQVVVDKFRLSGGKLGDVVGTSLDKGVEFDALAKAPDEERKYLIARAKAGENVSARRAPITLHGVQRAKGAGAPSQPGP
ncbi:MAG: hypothetical protein WBO09_06235 [Methylocystis silviterrae]|uniref:hypothetical protein n=1 Tax=Methylocystis silviterrae TaxID=2743612 RepID=UPI003C7421FC